MVHRRPKEFKCKWSQGLQTTKRYARNHANILVPKRESGEMRSLSIAKRDRRALVTFYAYIAR